MSANTYAAIPLTPEERAAALREVRRRMKKMAGGYKRWSELEERGTFACACLKDCDQRVVRFGDVAKSCEGEYHAVRRNDGADVLARMRANNAGRKRGCA